MRLVMNNGHERVVFGRRVRAGEEFEVPDVEARLWKLLGWASDVPIRSSKSMTAEPEPEPVRRGPGRPRKYPETAAPFYSRRDMRAEDE